MLCLHRWFVWQRGTANFFQWESKTRALPEIVSTCGGSTSWHRLEPAVAYNASCMAHTHWSTIGLWWSRNMVNEIFVRVFEICNKHCALFHDIAGWNAFCIGTQEAEGLNSFFPMANSHTKFWPLASVGWLASCCPKHACCSVITPMFSDFNRSNSEPATPVTQ